MSKVETQDGAFFCCEKCGKRLIKRLPNGLWHFVFGRSRTDKGDLSSRNAPVEMQIYGSIKMRCMRDRCREEFPDHWNVMDYLPFKAVKKDSEDPTIT